jgi:hypothetical protein
MRWAMRYSPAAIEIVEHVLLARERPASCQSLPYSPPPRRLARAKAPPASSQAIRAVEKLGVSEMSNPP